MATIEYELLRDFSELPKVRQTCALKTNGIKITNIPLLDLKISKLLGDTSPVGHQNSDPAQAVGTNRGHFALGIQSIQNGFRQ